MCQITPMWETPSTSPSTYFQWPHTIVRQPNEVESFNKKPDGTWELVVRIGDDIIDCTGVRRLTDAEQIAKLKAENEELKKQLNKNN